MSYIDTGTHGTHCRDTWDLLILTLGHIDLDVGTHGTHMSDLYYESNVILDCPTWTRIDLQRPN